MIIIHDKPGQLCNRLWSYVHFITFCLKEDNKFLTLSFADYYDLFDNLNKYPNIKFGIFGNIVDEYLRKVLVRGLRKCPDFILNSLHWRVDKANWNHESWSESTLLDKKNILFLSGWRHPKTNKYLEEFHESIRLIFKPKEESVIKFEKIINSQRAHYDVLVGIHIRRGDYVEFLGGVYFFDDPVYINYLHQIKDQLRNSGKTVAFLLCSNESINLDSYNAFNIFQINDAKSIEDLYALSLCDYILGVPSTYSMWASFYGKVPLRIIKYDNETITLDEFSVIIYLDNFANGTKLVHVTKGQAVANAT